MVEEICKNCDKKKADSSHHIVPRVFLEQRKVKICRDCHMIINNYFSNYDLFKLSEKGIYPTTKKFRKMLEVRMKEVEMIKSKGDEE